jgi:cytochrome c5
VALKLHNKVTKAREDRAFDSSPDCISRRENLCGLCDLAVDKSVGGAAEVDYCSRLFSSMRNRFRTTSACLALLAVASGFVSGARLPCPTSPAMSAVRLFDQANSAADGQKLFETRCFVCHGRGGKGDGPSATGLAERPQDLTDANWQRTTSDDRIRSVIQGGGAAIGKSGAMPPNLDLTQEQIQGLVAFVRSLSGK